MSYLALARKWRPRSFQELVGQDSIRKALTNSLKQQRVHHAYLFTGTRGVGKTSLARIMAKALNCEQGVTDAPCLQCDACVAIEQGRFLDLIEIDAASKTGVEDTRELMDNVAYAPVSGRYKIYLIDEVHMLSQHSFNALLKTLEEPPEHIKFLLATTEIQKLPPTVLSRCLQFNLKNLSPDIIVNQLRFILQKEQIGFEEAALPLLARAARGSMRDALSLLDQAIAGSDTQLVANDVKAMLGGTQQDYALALLEALALMDAGQLIALSRRIASEGGQFFYVLEEILQYLHQISLCHTLPDGTDFLDISDPIKKLALQFQSEEVQLFYHIGLKGIEEMKVAPTLSMGFEMTLLRMLTFKPKTSVSLPPLVDLPAQTAELLVEEPREPQEPEVATPSPSYPDPVQSNNSEDWASILIKLKLSGLARTAAENASFLKKDGSELILCTNKGHQTLFTAAVIQRIEEAWYSHFQEKIRLSLSFEESKELTPAQIKHQERDKNLQEAEAEIAKDPFLKQLQQAFSAEPVQNSIELLAPTL